MSIRDKKGRNRTYIQGHSTRLWDQKGEKSPSWKGGIYINSWGYLLRMRKGHPRGDKNGYVFEHILNFEDAHRCCVLVWGNIHHIDHNKLNNSSENLEGMTSSDHTLYHNAHRVYKKWSLEAKLRFKGVPRDWHGRILPKSSP
jgi:HNH endonuclease